MTHKPPKRRHTSRLHRLVKFCRPWHRRLGCVSALLVILVSLTGILINHSHQLSLDKHGVEQQWLLDHYGIKAPSNSEVFSLSPSLASTDNLLWLAGEQVLEANGPIISALAYQGMLVAIDSDTLYLVSMQGELLEKQGSATGLPANLSALAISPGTEHSQLWLNSSHGQFVADAELISWQSATPTQPLAWSNTLNTAQSHKLIETLTLRARASHLSWERVLLDIHSGRIIGISGPWLMDLVALSLIFMTLSGLYLWQQAKPKKRQSHRSH